MTEIQERAIEKLEAEKSVPTGQKEKAISKATADALKSFCRQSEDFARAVAEGGSFEECCKDVCKGIGNSISDFDVFSKAVQHYLPGTLVSFEMHITTKGVEKPQPQNTQDAFSFSLLDLL